MVQALLVSIWIVAVCSFKGSAGTVAYGVVTTFFAIYPLHLLGMGLAIWAKWKHRASTRFTTILLVLPWAGLPVPFYLNRLSAVGPLLDSPVKVINTVIVLIVLAFGLVLVRPRQAAGLIPYFLLRSFGLNLLILLGTLSLYLLPVGFVIFNREELSAPSTDWHDGYLVAYGLGALTVYIMASALPATLIAGYSGLSFFQKRITLQGKLRIAQLVAATPLVVVGLSMLVRWWGQKF